ncbi:MAG: carboxypeptidase M32 [archaeon]
MENSLFKNKLILKILDKYKPIWAIGHLNNLAGWDMQVNMPEEGIEARGEAIAQASSLTQKLFLEEEFSSLIQRAGKENGLNDYEKGILRILKRSAKQFKKLPKEFLEEFNKTTTEAYSVWDKAKKQNKFSLFSPHLEKIVDLSIKKAEYLGYREHPYDALLDEFEDGLTTKDVESFFDSIRQPLKNILARIKKSSEYKEKHPLEEESYDLDKMKMLNSKVLSLLNPYPKRLRMDISSHPFTSGLSSSDVRITTRYEGKDFARSLFSTVHEFGHALYELQCSPKLDYSPISGGSGMILHESQSRFWENIIGRTKSFIELFKEDITGLNPKFKDYSTEDIYQYFNLVKPSLIRTEADEVTYHFHIMIRFELEKALIGGKIKVKDLPRAWNEKYEEYLGVSPKNDTEGVLQDVHWSSGYIGYFPTYSMGTFLSGMINTELEKEFGKLEGMIKSKEGITKIQSWLKDKIHQYGSTYTMKDLTRKSFKKDFDPSYFISYLEKKYGEIY